MKVNQLKSKIFDAFVVNWTAKAICIVIAFLLYFFYNISQLGTNSISVPVTVQSNGQFMAVSSFQKHVRVTLRANPKDLAGISSREIKAVLNLDSYTAAGEFDIPVSLEFSPEIYLIDPFEAKVFPDRIHIQIEDKTFAYKDVNVSFSGQLPHGFEMVSYSVIPSSLKVTGARSAVEQTTNLLTNRLLLSNHTKTFSAPVKVSSLNSLVTIENEGEVFVTVEVQPVYAEKTLENIPLSFERLAGNLKILPESESLKHVSLKLGGDLLAIEKAEKDSVKIFSDCSKISEPGDYELTVNYMLPSGVKILEKTAEKVMITVELSGMETEPPAEADE